jgi:ABC-type branched-subunit amino acid transport system ATPase component
VDETNEEVVTLLKEVSLSDNEEEGLLIALIGPEGKGKSQLINVILERRKKIRKLIWIFITLILR